jgi:hypothetical protein
MKKILTLLVTIAAMCALPAPASAVEVTAHINGGGNGSWDALGLEPASQFGFGVHGIDLLSGGDARGQFQCIMAGRSAFPLGFPLFQSMSVHGPVDTGAITDVDPVTGLATAVINGHGTLHSNLVDGSTTKHDVVFTVELKEGGSTPGPTQGTLRLTGGPDPNGDDPGAPVFTFPAEFVTAGAIQIHLSPNLG